MIPIKATIEDLNSLLKFLRPTFGWTDLAKVKANLGSKVADNRKLEAAKYLGFVDREGQNIRITDQGRAYASAQDVDARAITMREQIAKTPLYLGTVSWMYHSNRSEPSKTDVGEHWHKHQAALLQGAQGAALTDGVIFFMRVAEAAGLGKFITAGRNRPETKFRGDRAALEEFAETYLLGGDEETPAPGGSADNDATAQASSDESMEKSHSMDSVEDEEPVAIGVQVADDHGQTRPAVQVKVEIQIAADATAETVAEIFKNLRKYVLNNPDDNLG